MKRLLILFSVCSLFSSCSDQGTDFLPVEKFSSVFVDGAQDASYEPLDVIQTEDNGYLVLAEAAQDVVFVLKLSPLGKTIWSASLPATFVNPVADLVLSEGKYYFIASARADQTAALIEVDDLNQTLAPAQRTYPGYRNPLAFGRLDTESFLMLNYNDTTGPVLSKIQSGFAQEWARRFDDAARSDIEISALRENTNVNFFVGGFNNGANTFFHSLRQNGYALTYTDAEGLETGQISGTAEDRIISYNYLGNLNGAINYQTNGVSFFQNPLPLQLNDSVPLTALEGDELTDKSRLGNAQIVNDEVVATTNLINIYDTADGRVKWTNYDITSGAISNIDYIGGSDLIVLKKAIRTRDGGLLILSKVSISGSRDRIAVQKIPEEELKGL